MDKKLTQEQIRNTDALKRAAGNMSKAIEQIAGAGLLAADEVAKLTAAFEKLKIKYPKDFPD